MIDILRSAQILFTIYSDEAYLQADQRTNELLVEGDLEG